MNRPLQEIEVFALQDRRAHGKAKPWVVRWRVNGHREVPAGGQRKSPSGSGR